MSDAGLKPLLLQDSAPLRPSQLRQAASPPPFPPSSTPPSDQSSVRHRSSKSSRVPRISAQPLPLAAGPVPLAALLPSPSIRPRVWAPSFLRGYPCLVLNAAGQQGCSIGCQRGHASFIWSPAGQGSTRIPAGFTHTTGPHGDRAQVARANSSPVQANSLPSRAASALEQTLFPHLFASVLLEQTAHRP